VKFYLEKGGLMSSKITIKYPFPLDLDINREEIQLGKRYNFRPMVNYHFVRNFFNKILDKGLIANSEREFLQLDYGSF
jgi:hypothetical protein